MKYVIAQMSWEYELEHIYGPFATVEEARETALKLATVKVKDLANYVESPEVICKENDAFVREHNPQHLYADEDGYRIVAYFETHKLVEV